MEFDDLLNLVGDEPVFNSALLMAGAVDPRLIRQQLSRWVKAGKVYQLRRGLYSFAPPYQKNNPIPFSGQSLTKSIVRQFTIGACVL